MLRLLIIITAVIAAFVLGVWYFYVPTLNDVLTDGAVRLEGLSAPVTIRRDENFMPYIQAETLDDAMRAHGFVTGQDRLTQMEFARRAAHGRLSEVFGEATYARDVEARVIGFSRIAAAQDAILDEDSRHMLDLYADGLNTYITRLPDELPFELKVLGVEPEPWTRADLLALLFYGAWGNAANFHAELIAQGLADRLGPEKAGELAPIVINPDDARFARTARAPAVTATRYAGLDIDFARSTAFLDDQAAWRGGSNNWAVAATKSTSGAAIVANDPHLDSRDLPGFWHPVGIITPEVRVVGVAAGFPGFLVGRTDHVAFGVTNGYGDMIDLYIENEDPGHPGAYLEGDRSLPFDIREEVIRVRDDDAPDGVREETIVVRATSRGPIISDHGLATGSGDLVSVRWSAAEAMTPDLGLFRLFRARNVDEALDAIAATRVISFNVTVGDADGRVARRASGAVPIRTRGDGGAPLPVNDGSGVFEDPWAGFIPGEEMPGDDGAAGWVGSANHYTPPADYPWPYTTYASPSYRYRRIIEIFDGGDAFSAEDLWNAQLDTKNLLAERITPILLAALGDDAAYAPLTEQLKDWDFEDRADSAAPTVFQALYRNYAIAAVSDELGDELAEAYLSAWYVWMERLEAMTVAGASPWFDDVTTDGVTETRDDLIRRAADAALAELTERFGPTASSWTWGDVHRMRFRGPMRRTGFVGRLTGNQDYAKDGSGETLNRALYSFPEPYDPPWVASMRMVADFADDEKVMAHIAGGVSGRTFSKHLNDQTDEWAAGEPLAWWFSDEAIAAHAKSTLRLEP